MKILSYVCVLRSPTEFKPLALPAPTLRQTLEDLQGICERIMLDNKLHHSLSSVSSDDTVVTSQLGAIFNLPILNGRSLQPHTQKLLKFLLVCRDQNLLFDITSW